MTELYNNGDDDEGESHWYTQDGRPLYQVPRADGLGLRNTTVADARKLHLLPSVTSILSILYKPGLATWINQQYVLAALTLPRNDGEALDAFAARVVRDAKSEGRAAADAGTRIHKAIECWLMIRDGHVNFEDADLPDLTITETHVVQGIIEWSKTNTIEPEALENTFSHFATDSLGYGGRIDFVGSINGVRVVADWKTQQTTPNKPMIFYPEWGVQLAAYAHGIGEPELPGLSVVISRNEPGRVMPYLWMDDWRWPAFEAAKFLYHSPLGSGGRLGR